MRELRKSDLLSSCGPAILRTLFGRSSTFWERKIRKYRKTHKPEGLPKNEAGELAWTFNNEIGAVVRDQLKNKFLKFKKPNRKMSLRTFARTLAKRNKTYLVSLTNHFCVLQNGRIFDNSEFDRFFRFFRYSRDMVDCVMELPNYKLHKTTKDHVREEIRTYYYYNPVVDMERAKKDLLLFV